MEGCMARLVGFLVLVIGLSVWLGNRAEEKKRVEEIARIERTPELWPEYKALKLAVAANLRAKAFTERCTDWRNRNAVTSTLVVVPINSDIVEAAARYSERYTRKFGSRNRPGSIPPTAPHKVDSDTAAFALFVLNNEFDESRGEVFLNGGLQNALALRDERGTLTHPVRYTRNFDDKLGAGVNAGFFYVPNPSRSGDASYTLHVTDLVIRPCAASPPARRSASFVYTRPEFDYLALVQNGITETSLYELPEMKAADGGSNMETVRNVSTFLAVINGFIMLLTKVGFL